MPERPRPNLDRVREALEDHDERVAETPDEPAPKEEDEPQEDDGDA